MLYQREVMERLLGIAWSRAPVLIALLLATASFVAFGQRRKSKLPDVPILQMSDAPGQAGIAEDLAAFIRNGKEVLQIGYDRYSKNGQNYLLRTPWRLMFVVAPRFINEIAWATGDKLDNHATHNELLQTRYTMHKSLEDDAYYLDVVGRQLTRNIGPGIYDLVDEAKQAIQSNVGAAEHWKTLGMYDAAFRITTRTANRFFFGKQLAIDEEFLQLAIGYSSTVFGGAATLRNFHPLVNIFQFLKPLIVAWRTNIYKDQALARSKLGPILRDRMDQEARGEKSTARDAIQWILNITPPEKRNVDLLVYRMMHLTIVAVHTSSVSFLDCVNELAERPDIHEELRSEILDIFAEEGGQWNQQGLSKLVKLDSFMRETVRFNTNGAGHLDRIAMSDTVLSDGTVIPRGTYITVPSVAMNCAEDWWESATVFDPWRFCKKRITVGTEKQHSTSFVQTAPTYLHFGHGRHACPGRFFAAVELKILLVLTLMNYDVKLSDEGKLPNLWQCRARFPDTRTKAEFKQRGNVDDMFRL